MIMKTMRVTRVFNSGLLHAELQAAGIPVVTVRASSPDMGGPAFYGVVVLDDKADLKKAQALITAHQEPRKPSRAPDAKQMDAALRQMEKL
jgi:hypothetical protein